VKIRQALLVLWLSAIGMAAYAGAEGTSQEEPISEANTVLFMSDHLADVRQPMVLRYDFRKSGTLEEGFVDTVDVNVGAPKANGGKDVRLRYFTGERARQFPPVQDAKGNPVLLLFLQRDVGEMQRLTEGNWRYFQRVIKLALANAAQVKPVEFEFRGQPVQGTEIRITPYLNDAHAELNRFNAKYYVFTLSEAIPGHIYQLRAVIPDKAAGGKSVLMEESITFRGAEPLARR